MQNNLAWFVLVLISEQARINRSAVEINEHTTALVTVSRQHQRAGTEVQQLCTFKLETLLHDKIVSSLNVWSVVLYRYSIFCIFFRKSVIFILSLI
jgi:hypothetical protein